MPKAEDYLYPNQIIVEIDDYDGLRTENDRLRAEVARLHERLEDNHWFEQDANGNMVRVECDPGSIPDGISCRDETIKLQDDSNDRLRASLRDHVVRNGELREALEDLLNLKQGCHERADAILDRLSNETEGK